MLDLGEQRAGDLARDGLPAKAPGFQTAFTMDQSRTSKAASARADITMSVCNGAFLLADAGLLDGLFATAHRSAYAAFARQYPKVKLVRGARFVENRDISSSGGESCGIDLALRVVERYYGARRAADSALALEYVRTPRPA